MKLRRFFRRSTRRHLRRDCRHRQQDWLLARAEARHDARLGFEVVANWAAIYVMRQDARAIGLRHTTTIGDPVSFGRFAQSLLRARLLVARTEVWP
jgi:hypothetical protein